MNNKKFAEVMRRAKRLLRIGGTWTTRLRSAVDAGASETTNKHNPSIAGAFRIVSVGGLNWRNGYEYVLVAIHQLVVSGTPVQYHLIGDGEDRQRILFTIFDLQLQDHVTLHDSQPRNKSVDCIRQADVFLLSSLNEITTDYLLEAMIHGIPVVTTDCSGIREAVTDGIDGFIVPVRDPSTLALALQKLAMSPELRHTVGKAGRERIFQELEGN